MESFRPEGVNLPNVMTPGAWVIVVVVVLAIAAGVSFMVWKLLSSRIRWESLGYMGVQFFTEDGRISAPFLIQAVDKARAFIILHTQWPSREVEKALTAFNVYVHADDVNAGKVGITGYQNGSVLGVNRKLTTLCHEMLHLAMERLEGVSDVLHARWQPGGEFDKAERAYSDWLHGANT